MFNLLVASLSTITNAQYLPNHNLFYKNERNGKAPSQKHPIQAQSSQFISKLKL